MILGIVSADLLVKLFKDVKDLSNLFLKNIDDYQVLKSLGSGLSAQVYLGQNKKTGEKLAIKCYKPDQDLVEKEYQILKVLKDHPNIIKVHDFKSNAISQKKQQFKKQTKIMKKSSSYLVLEYAGKGDLLTFIQKNKSLDEKICRNIFTQLLNTIEFIHQKGYVHFDIKPDNILLNEEFKIKIADFGLAQNKFSRFIHNKIGGTQEYLPPDVFCGQNVDYRNEIDMFGAAITLFLMKVGRNPFKISDPLLDKLYYLIAQKKYDEFWEFHQSLNKDLKLSNSFKDLFQKMVAFNKDDRITIKEIKKHDWLQGPIADVQDFQKLL